MIMKISKMFKIINMNKYFQSLLIFIKQFIHLIINNFKYLYHFDIFFILLFLLVRYEIFS